jgi:3-deoxy-D-manno-octulosonate 8-phosphate phosphatase (KDO 8-P phosphatase)
VITARRSPMVERRGEELKLVEVIQGRRDKLNALRELLERQKVEPSRCAYMGDDITDLAAMGHVGLSACPADAALEVRHLAAFVASSAGGRGAVRELLELCLRASGRWQAAIDQCVSPESSSV